MENNVKPNNNVSNIENDESNIENNIESNENNIDVDAVEGIIESLLFISGDPLSLEEIQKFWRWTKEGLQK